MISIETAKLISVDMIDTIERPGIKDLKDFLISSDFFTAPASAKFHDNFLGGLLIHSLRVYAIMNEKKKLFKYNLSDESIFITAFFHDLCKVNFYSPSDEPITSKQLTFLDSLAPGLSVEMAKNGEFLGKAYASQLIEFFKQKGKREDRPKAGLEWGYKDQFPVGHGEKSVFILQRYIKLTDEEVAMIRFHMVGVDPAIHFGYPTGTAFKDALSMYPNIVALFVADWESSFNPLPGSNLW